MPEGICRHLCPCVHGCTPMHTHMLDGTGVGSWKWRHQNTSKLGTHTMKRQVQSNEQVQKL